MAKKALLLSSAILFSLITACSTSNTAPNIAGISKAPAVVAQPKLLAGQVIPSTNTIFVADLGQGKKGGDINFTLDLSEKVFSTKATSGFAQGLRTDITDVRIYLLRGATATTDPYLIGNQVMVQNITTSAFSGGATSKNYRISNLVVSGAYYIGVECYKSLDNITKDNASITVGSNKKMAISSVVTVTNNSGGSGTITVSGDVTIPVALRDGVGASVDATVTPTDGATTGATTITQLP